MVLVGMLVLPTTVRAQEDSPVEPPAETALAAAQADVRVVVIDSVQAALGLKLSVRQAIATALDDLSAPMVPLEDVLPEDATCADAPCYAGVAKRVGATHILLVQGVANPAGYRLSIEVRDGETGMALGSDGKDCELCSEDQLAPTVQEKVSALWMRVVREQAIKAEQERQAKEVLKPVRVTMAEKPETPPWYMQRTPGLGLGFAGLGLLGVGFGVYYIAVDGNTAEKSAFGDPILVRDTSKWGWTFAGLGAVSLLAGSAMIIWGREDGSDETEVSVAVGPGRLGLLGKF
jgi:hypothetical protein